MKPVFILNCGSTSVKYTLFDCETGCRRLTEGVIERVMERFGNHHKALQMLFTKLHASGRLLHPERLHAAVHRVVHGGERFTEPAVIDREVLAQIRRLMPLAPLHNPANVAGIEAMRNIAPQIRQIAVFDTAFHQTMPPEAYRYAIPQRCYTNEGIRRFGFHGISHHYLRERAAAYLGIESKKANLITLHLGGGASAAAIKEGKSVDTSMGFTPLEGLVMGTRSGDLDPGIVTYWARDLGMEYSEIDTLLNHESGLAGLCGKSDMRDILAAVKEGDSSARFAFDLFCRRIRKYIGAYMVLLDRVDALVFSGGIGSNSAEVREAVCKGLERFGFCIDAGRNRRACDDVIQISSEKSASAILAIRTDEALQMAKEAMQYIT